MKKLLIVTFVMAFGFTLYANLINDNTTTNEQANICLLANNMQTNYKAGSLGNECYCDRVGPDLFEGYVVPCEPETGYICNALTCTGSNNCCYSNPHNQD